jgi:hypothetical protein
MKSILTKTVALASVLALSASPLAAPSDVFESPSPQYKSIEMLLLKDNVLTQNFGAANARMHVYAGPFITFDNNIYLQEDEQSDTITSIISGVEGIFMQEETYQLSLGAQYRDHDYARHDEDSSEYTFNPDLLLIFNDMVQLRLTGAFSKTVSPLDDQGVALAPTRVQSKTAGGGAVLTLTPSEIMTVDMGYSIRAKQYADAANNGIEYTQNQVFVNPKYILSGKTNVGVKLTYGTIDYRYNVNNESDYLDLRATMEYNPTAKLTFNATAGAMDRDYDEDGLNPDDDDFTGFVASAGLSYDWTDKWTFGGMVLRDVFEDPSATSNFYEYTRLALTAAYAPVTPLKLNGTLFYDMVEPNVGDDSDRTGASVSATWALTEFVGLGAAYEYKTKDSDANNADYDSSVATLGLWVSF